MTEIVIQNIEQIADVYLESVNKLDKKQISDSLDIVFRRYADKISELSDFNCTLQRYLSDTNIESGKYKITLLFTDNDDKIAIEEYLDNR